MESLGLLECSNWKKQLKFLLEGSNQEQEPDEKNVQEPSFWLSIVNSNS